MKRRRRVSVTLPDSVVVCQVSAATIEKATRSAHFVDGLRAETQEILARFAKGIFLLSTQCNL
jgi:hypothetical protein